MNDELEKYLDGSGRGIIELVSRHFPAGTEEHHGKPQST
jgi:hypothetical protein